MINLLDETESFLRENGKSFDDVLWVGGRDFSISLENFIQVANKEYDNGFGAPKVAQDLKLVGKDWWLARVEYDGAEGWEFYTLPVKPSEELTVKRLVCEEAVGWRDLKDIE